MLLLMMGKGEKFQRKKLQICSLFTSKDSILVPQSTSFERVSPHLKI